MSDLVQPPFLLQCAALRDPRQAAQVLYRLPEVVLLLLCGTIAGADDYFVELALWGGEPLAFLRRFLPYMHGVPSHDTLCDVVAALDPELFKACFARWVERLCSPAAPGTAGPGTAGPGAGEREVIAIDGKTSRRSHARSRAAAHGRGLGQRLVLGQEAVSDPRDHRNPLAAATPGAGWRPGHHRRDGHADRHRQAIVDRGGDYLLALKGNRPETFASLAALFAVPPPKLAIGTHDTIDGGHGRVERRRSPGVETRTHRVCHEVGWLFSDRRHPGEPRVPGLAMVGMVESATERAGKVEHERRYYLCSAKLDADTFARAVRSHWGVENRLHWMLGVVFHDDLARLRTGQGPANMAVVKPMALNLLHQAKPAISLKNQRKRAGWNSDDLAQVIQQTT